MKCKATNMEVVLGTNIPVYTLKQLERTHNVLIPRKVVVKYGESELLKIYKDNGYKVRLQIVRYKASNAKYPMDASYIIEKV